MEDEQLEPVGDKKCLGTAPLCENGYRPVCVNGQWECRGQIAIEDVEQSDNIVDGSEQGNGND